MLELLSVAAFTSSKSSDKTNEDAILLPQKKQSGYIFAIADGVGSYAGADIASKLVIDYMANLKEILCEEKVERILIEIKNRLIELGNKKEGFHNAATTLTVGFLEESGLHIIHVGDSRLYVKKEQKLIKYTKDHTQHQKLLDEGLYTERQLRNMSGKNILVAALSGNINLEYQYLFLDKDKITCEDGEIVINLMSDGAYEFWEKRPKFSQNTMSNPTAFSTSLQRRIEKNGPVDDYSLVSVKFRTSK